MLNKCLKRILISIPVLIGVVLIIFIMLRIIPGNPVTTMLGEHVNQAVIDKVSREMGLDQPFIIQYFQWVGKIFTGNMGYSYIKNQEVFPMFMQALPNTLLLTLSSIVTTILISIPLGIWSAVKQNKITDYVIRVCTFIGNAMPNFFIALLLIYVFALQLHWFPVMGNNGFISIILPTLTLALAMSAKYTRQVRATVLDELNKDYVIGARARGIKERTIVLAHVLKSSMLTIVTLLGLSLGSLLGGTAIVESIFMWPGVGKLAVDAISSRDYQVIQVYVIWMAIIYVAINLITDIVYHYLDPRIRIQGEEG